MKRWGNWLITLILGLALAALILILLLPVVFSSRVAIVLSGSMEPAMPRGALAIPMPVAPEDIRVEDIITYNVPWEPDVTVSHRVVEVLTDGELTFRTKGDANEDIDPWIVLAENVTGRVVYNIPRLGYITNTGLTYTRTWWGFALLIGLPSILVIGSAIRGLTRSANPRHQRMQSLLKRRRRHR